MDRPALLRFGEGIELDLHAYELRRAGQAVRLERIPMEILIFLVERRPGLVTREEIAEKVWGRGVFGEIDNSINGAIRKIRLALEDDADQPRYILTVTARGYRFIATVTGEEVEVPAPENPKAPEVPEAAARPVDPSRFRAARRWTVIAGAAALALGVGLYVRAAFPTPPPATDERVMLAVLPFDNLTGDPGQDYFAEGFTEEMITRLGGFAPQKLGVIARTSVVFYKNEHVPLDRLGRELGVRYVLEGSVRRDADRIRITAQLIQIKDQTHLWAREYDRGQGDVLRVQDEIARAIADQIVLSLGQTAPPATTAALSPRDYAAHDDYLKGRYYWNQRTEKGERQAVESFLASIAKNPQDARVYAGLADAYALMGSYNLAPRAVSEKAREAALKALEIDPNLAEAHTSLALINEQYDWDWKTAGERFRKAIELNPNYATAHHWYAEYLSFMGRHEEALAEVARARRLDPRSLIIQTDEGVFLYYARDFDRSIDAFRSVLTVDPAFPRANMIIAAYAQEGRFEEALADVREWRRRDENIWAPALAAYVHGRQGDVEKARQDLAEVERQVQPAGSNPGPRIVAYLGLGLKEEAFAALQQACEGRWNAVTALKVDPIFDPLRDDPRYQDLLRCAGLGP